MSSRYDVVVGGGSVAGLSFAASAAKGGLDVLVLEQDDEVGEPETCDGMVSLRQLGRHFPPASDCVQSEVKSGTLHSPSGFSVTFDASRLEVVVLDRSAYDKQLAAQAKASGAIIRTGCRVTGASEKDDSVEVSADDVYTCSYYVDATGASSLRAGFRERLIPAAKYEVEASWIEDGQVEVFLDSEKYPGFFAWVIPMGKGVAKVGAAGRKINSFAALDSFLEKRPHKVLRKVAAPLCVGGSTPEFVTGRTIKIGEACGEVKPTTAGGITTSVEGGVMAAKWVAEAVRRRDRSLVLNYQADWHSTFGKEFRTMLRLRDLFERLTNEDLDRVLKVLSSSKVPQRLARTDFDFHATALLSALGVGGVLRLSGVLASAEARQVLDSLGQ